MDISTNKKSTKSNAKVKQINGILKKVSDLCKHAIDNLCIEQREFEELEEMLWKLVK